MKNKLFKYINKRINKINNHKELSSKEQKAISQRRTICCNVIGEYDPNGEKSPYCPKCWGLYEIYD